ncbi:MAG: hypothetical protein IAB19_04180 [Proteobacteria bacterium]|uniref:Uncharacterized protein n=1 Tax=Candidatus Avisuccinivibrio stercorigallinarum TaxID=2840704 RepID=A0A9D9D9I1_9GAMM|nr:hypothetical protein [Candidatus Avisuccinivibrio stercorigallinarum]
MYGTIIAVNQRQLDISAQDKIYQAELSADLAKPTPGDQAEFEPLAAPSVLQKGAGRLIQISKAQLPQDIAWSGGNYVEGHQVQDMDSSFELCTEGADFGQCCTLLAKKAQEAHANALLQFKVEFVKRPLHQPRLCRLSAVPAQIKGEVYKPEPGISLQLPTKFLRRNSPNNAAVRYRIVLLICLLMIVEPCLASLTRQGLWPVIIGEGLMAALPIFCLAAALLSNPRRLVFYLRKAKRGPLKA